MKSQTAMEIDKLTWDLESALTRMNNDNAFLLEISAIFLLRSQELLQLLQEAAAKGDSASVEIHAHSLRGSAGNISAPRMKDMSHTVELLGEENNLGNINFHITELQNETTRVQEAVRQWMIKVKKPDEN